MKGQRRFRLGEIVRYGPLECMGDIWDKTKMPDGTIDYTIRLEGNIDGLKFAHNDGMLLEHLSE